VSKNNQHAVITAAFITIGVIIGAMLSNFFLMLLFNSTFAPAFNLSPIDFWQTAELNLILILLASYFLK
jgi:hypothetical protein